jgi:hypothetical protein
MDLLERLEKVFPNVEIRCLTEDREFVGKECPTISDFQWQALEDI